ncbi:hypothetical protein BSKO_12530 [Bryopsis sp. KO-2023]|nr:hypothetical protein BSKO_12530 [Bryopsis sp. KO-2023]
MSGGSESDCSSEDGPQTAALRLVVGDELGVLRVVEVPSRDRWHGAKIVKKWGPNEGGPPDRTMGIKTLSTASREGLTDTEFAVVCLSRVDGTIEVRGAEDFSVRGTVKPFVNSEASEQKGNPAQIVSITPTWNSRNDTVPNLLSCCDAGVVRLSRPSRKNSNTQMKESMSLLVADSITAACADLDQRILAVGGDGCHLRMVDLDAQKITFKGKAPDNPYGLTKRNWTTACAIVPNSDCNLILVGTADHEVRLYDVRAGKRPVSKIEWRDARVMAMATESNGDNIWMANALGHMERYDVSKRRLRGTLTGRITGSIRSMVAHPERPLLASAGLDRCVRLHDTAQRVMRVKVYVKYQCTGVDFLPVPEGYEGECEEKVSEDEEKAKVREMIGGQGFSPPRLRGKHRFGARDFSRGRSRGGASSFKRPRT